MPWSLAHSRLAKHLLYIERFEKEEVLVACCSAAAPGETIFVPGGWWHSVTMLSPPLLQNMMLEETARPVLAENAQEAEGLIALQMWNILRK